MENEEKVNNFKSGLKKIVEIRESMVRHVASNPDLWPVLDPMIKRAAEAIRELKAMLPESEV